MIARIRAIVADLFVSSTATPYTQTYAYFAGGYLGHAWLAQRAAESVAGWGLPAWVGPAVVLGGFIGVKETVDFLRSRAPLWRRCGDYAVDASAYGLGLWAAGATGVWASVSFVATVAAGLAATVVWDALREGDSE